MEDDLEYMLDKWKLTPACNAISLVVVGKLGNGKSATGNSILGRPAFKSDIGQSRVTSTSELQSALLKDGRAVNIIDTPGLFDSSNDSEFVGREIVKCIDLAKDGLHAILMVFSISSHFTKEEEASIENMKTLFGDRIVDYMIIVFTGEDVLESNGKTLKEYTSQFPEPLKNIIQLCKNRVVFFDNHTKDRIKKQKQVEQLFSLVYSVVVSNGGKPFSNQKFAEVKEGPFLRQQQEKQIEASKGHSNEELTNMKQEIYKSYDEQIKRTTEMLAEEQRARLEAEKIAEASRLRYDEEIEKLKKELKMALADSRDFRKQAESWNCAIL